jgi:isopentenyl-diphosphate delta-isomerase
MKEEPIAVVDAFMRPTGQVLLKSEVHAKELWHTAVHVWIYNSRGQVLMQLRSPAKVIYPGKWDVSVGGHVAGGQTMVDAAIQETKEEIGIDLKESDLELVGINKSSDVHPTIGRRHRIFHWTFIAKKDAGISSLTLETEEVTDVRWIAIDDLKKELADPESKARLHTQRPLYMYGMALDEITARLSAKNSG